MKKCGNLAGFEPRTKKPINFKSYALATWPKRLNEKVDSKFIIKISLEGVMTTPCHVD